MPPPSRPRPRNREERLERCLQHVQSELAAEAEYQERFMGADPKDNLTLALCNQLCARITRTLRPRPITSKDIRRLLSQDPET